MDVSSAVFVGTEHQKILRHLNIYVSDFHDYRTFDA